jgi:hypothetical protein
MLSAGGRGGALFQSLSRGDVRLRSIGWFIQLLPSATVRIFASNNTDILILYTSEHKTQKEPGHEARVSYSLPLCFMSLWDFCDESPVLNYAHAKLNRSS